MKKLTSAIELENRRKEILKSRDTGKPCITICCGTGCRAYGAEKVANEFIDEKDRRGLNEEIDIKATGCHGFCERGPLVVIRPKEIFYQHVTEDDVGEIIEKTILKDEIIGRLQYFDSVRRKKMIYEHDIPFYREQERTVFKYNGIIDPTRIDDYLSVDGYTALTKVIFEMTSHEVIEEIKKSGLRGRGGAGFPTGLKWELLANQPNRKIKYLVCNGDEGDPGAYMDRSVLEGNPQSVIEGMLIGAYCTNARQGIIYVRTEYPLAIKHLRIALQQASELGFLGEKILGTDFSFDIKLIEGAGAFVCGEETALIQSIEGKRSVPVQRPPFPVEKGINGNPTAINNVETWVNIPIIIRNGAENFMKTGTQKSPGTKIFSLVGKIKNTGLVEVPMGITIKKIVDEIGGGPSGRVKIKAIQTGGPSGGCLPVDKFDLTIDYESLTEAGSMMGSGGLIVMDEHTCMVDVVKFFLSFTSEESCGKCTPCRVGTRQMLEILNKITKGNGESSDLERLENLAQTVKNGSLCGLGQTAPNPVYTALQFFREEFETHVVDKRCPATVCRDLVEYRVIPVKCTGCTLCVGVCPTNAITGPRSKPHNLDPEKCIKCRACYEICRFDAIAGDAIVIE
jgi:NADH:ubiquinone oxidoreductase subunit F (NADH-binding)/(2Fe-2S) ferredoxin/NAD-dependent dihydropyrimidine dehydrogenase PreA subunit